MRLTDVDSVVKYIEELKTPDAPLIARIVLDNIELFVKNAPTIDAIPMERVARMFAEFTELAPCGYGFDNDEWCDENCSKHENKDCWLHVLNEGWLD